jgi:hypothetical protein
LGDKKEKCRQKAGYDVRDKVRKYDLMSNDTS